MSQHDMNVANGSGATVRGDLNNALVALAGVSSGATEPTTTFAYQLWADTTTGLLKQRNGANTVWKVRGTLADTLKVARSSNTILAAGDFGKSFVATATFTQTVTAAATLGDGWIVSYRVNVGATVTIDPNGTEQIDGATTKVVVGPASGIIFCDGSNFFTYGFDQPAASAAVAGVIEIATQAEVDAMTDTSRAMTPNHNKIILGTEQASTSDTAIDFTGIPAGVKRVTVMGLAVSANGSGNLVVRIGPSAGPEATSYVTGIAQFTNAGAIGVSNVTDGFYITSTNGSGNTTKWKMVLTLEDAAANEWSCYCVSEVATILFNLTVSNKAIAGALSVIRITTTTGDTFDAGAINIAYER